MEDGTFESCLLYHANCTFESGRRQDMRWQMERMLSPRSSCCFPEQDLVERSFVRYDILLSFIKSNQAQRVNFILTPETILNFEWSPHPFEMVLKLYPISRSHLQDTKAQYIDLHCTKICSRGQTRRSTNCNRTEWFITG